MVKFDSHRLTVTDIKIVAGADALHAVLGKATHRPPGHQVEIDTRDR